MREQAIDLIDILQDLNRQADLDEGNFEDRDGSAIRDR